MAKRRILLDGEELLRKKSRPVEKFDGRLHELLDDMAETMAEAQGVGLAAPQVGALRRAVIIDVGDGLIELVNPVRIGEDGEQTGDEGCLSIPEKKGLVSRPYKVTVRAQDRHGEFFELSGEGYLARAICHEIDHLNGVLYTDIMIRDTTGEEVEDVIRT
ncbi:MAG: peptide deformylase [Christensenellales bacterium]|jgi:peptide deformylase